MTVFISTTTVTILRTVTPTLNGFGDETDVDTVVAINVPASITENPRNRRTRRGERSDYKPSDQRTTRVETFAIRFRPDIDIYEHDRVLDDRTNIKYQVYDVSNPHTIIGMADVRCLATRVGAVSQPVNG